MTDNILYHVLEAELKNESLDFLENAKNKLLDVDEYVLRNESEEEDDI